MDSTARDDGVAYEMPYDAEASLQVGKVSLWDSYADFVGKQAPAWFFGFLAVAVATILIQEQFGRFAALFTAGLAAVPVCFAYHYILYRHSLRTFHGNYHEVSWTYKMTDSRWIYERNDGLILSVPWKIMRKIVDVPAGFIVCYGDAGDYSAIVSRRQLIAHGTEQDFLNRIGKDAIEAK